MVYLILQIHRIQQMMKNHRSKLELKFDHPMTMKDRLVEDNEDSIHDQMVLLVDYHKIVQNLQLQQQIQYDMEY